MVSSSRYRSCGSGASRSAWSNDRAARSSSASTAASSDRPSTRCASWRPKDDGITDRADSAACWSESSRSNDHWTVARSVCERPRVRRRPPVSMAKRSSRCAAISSTVNTEVRAAASSIASGRPSSRRQISATDSSSSADQSSTRRFADRENNTIASSPLIPRRPTTRSPSTARASRDVASTRTSGHAPSNASIRSATSSMTCSQLSTTRSIDRVAR